MYEWLTGSLPFQGAWYALAAQKALSSPRLLHEQAPTISPAVEQVVLRALAADPKARFASVQSFAAAFEQACQVQSGSPAFLPARPNTAGMPSFVSQGSTWLAQPPAPPAAQALQPAQDHAPAYPSAPSGAASGLGNVAVPVVQSIRPVGRKRKASPLKMLLIILGILIAPGLIGGVGAAFLLRENHPATPPCKPENSLKCQKTPEPTEHASPAYSLNVGTGTVIVWVASKRPDLV